MEVEPCALYTPKQVRALEEGRLDAGLLRTPPEHDFLEVLPVGREPLLAVLPEDHPLACEERVPLAALADEARTSCSRPVASRRPYTTG